MPFQSGQLIKPTRLVLIPDQFRVHAPVSSTETDRITDHPLLPGTISTRAAVRKENRTVRSMKLLLSVDKNVSNQEEPEVTSSSEICQIERDSDRERERDRRLII